MDPETSQSLNLLPGTNGQEETQPEEKPQVSPKKPQKHRRSKPASESEHQAAEVVVESAKPAVQLSPEDLKLAIQMNKHIMGVLGLDKKSRSFRV
jgi:hypothetical protein